MAAAKRSHQAQRQSAAESGTAESTNRSDIHVSKRFKSDNAGSDGRGLGKLLDSKASRKKLTATLTNGTPNEVASRVNDQKTHVATVLNGAVIDTNDVSDASSSDEEEESEDDGETDEEADSEQSQDGDEDVNDKIRTTKADRGDNQTSTNGTAHDDDTEMRDQPADHDDEDAAEPSFGDILKARHPEMIDLQNQIIDPYAVPSQHIAAAGENALISQLSGHSLATILQQALKTEDKDMLEKCLHLNDTQAIKNTIQRLPSPLVGTLLTRISERLYRRPGRAGPLMLWIQWSLVAHGGYLATQPDVLRKLKALNQVIRQRAQGLQSLLQLKGKLDLLSAQLELRRTIRNQRRHQDEADEDEALLYVEGDTKDDWEEDEFDNVPQIEASESALHDGSTNARGNGIDEDSADENEEVSEEEVELIDIEAEEEEEDDGDLDDDDGDEDEDDDAEDSEDLSISDEELDDESEADVDSEPEIEAPTSNLSNRKR